MGYKNLWDKETGKLVQVEPVDAREILANSPDRYTDVRPEGAEEGSSATATVVDGRVAINFQSMSLADLRIYADKAGIDLSGADNRREDVLAAIEMHQANDPAQQVNPAKGGPIYPPAGANQVQQGGTAARDPSKTAKNAAKPDKKGNKAGAGSDDEGEDDGLEAMTVADLKEHAESKGVDLTGVTKKDDIIAAIRAQDNA